MTLMIKTLMPKFKIVQPRCNGLCYANSVELAVWLISRGGGWRSRTDSRNLVRPWNRLFGEMVKTSLEDDRVGW